MFPLRPIAISAVAKAGKQPSLHSNNVPSSENAPASILYRATGWAAFASLRERGTQNARAAAATK